MGFYIEIIYPEMTDFAKSEEIAVTERTFLHMSPFLNFQINDTDPPEGAHPVGRGYWLMRPEPQGTDGRGRPVKAVGQPYIRIGFNWLNEIGWNWYMGFLDDEEDLSVDLISITVWDPMAENGPDWVRFSGTDERPIILARPTYEDIVYGGFEGVEILITEIS